ncbi:DUF6894 family protein [Brevundimonas sp. GCM10030266]|uniref:DUF6894 family protein n=1 Tax=Brevundimonas sp. GCM10030266 TaxID=3273386 RepID=UPI003623D858
MARYFIHLLDGDSVRDEDGEDFPDLDSARRAALRTLAQSLASREDRFWMDGLLKVVLEDEQGRQHTVLEVRDVTPES